MKPSYAHLKASYPRLPEYPIAKLYDTIGWSDLKNMDAYRNTCATRMSLALLKAGVSLPGRMAINAGPLKGRRVEPGQAKLSNILKSIFGQPEVFRSRAAARKAIGRRTGIVSFFRLTGAQDRQGHIDIISPENDYFKCEMSCYFDSVEIWFWPLD